MGVLLMVLSGCAGLAHQFPASSPSVASGADPALDAQAKLLESAYRAYVQERYPLAAMRFQRFVDSNPSSPRLSEARWWLARSHEARGDLPAALSVYRTVVGAAPPSVPLTGTYAFHALNRLDTFRRSFGSTSLLERRQVALWLPDLGWFTTPDAGLWIAQLADAGVTSLIFEAGATGPMGVSGHTTKAPVVADRLKAIVPVAHAKGMAVLASNNQYEPGWMTVNPEWRTIMTNGMGQQAGFVDILQPEYQRVVGDVAQDLLRTDIDGLVVG
ncbi:MAG: tetratricopeptide repeat protein, partial [Nitrospirota bacterium]|nr:tetratricopeptide repeat protein [Nitrospirota bacterium]